MAGGDQGCSEGTKHPSVNGDPTRSWLRCRRNASCCSRSCQAPTGRGRPAALPAGTWSTGPRTLLYVRGYVDTWAYPCNTRIALNSPAQICFSVGSAGGSTSHTLCRRLAREAAEKGRTRQRRGHRPVSDHDAGRGTGNMRPVGRTDRLRAAIPSLRKGHGG